MAHVLHVAAPGLRDRLTTTCDAIIENMERGRVRRHREQDRWVIASSGG